MDAIALYPEDRDASSPSAARMVRAFDSLARHHLLDADANLVQTFSPTFTPLQSQLLDRGPRST
jgi:hypothetical protein